MRAGPANCEGWFRPVGDARRLSIPPAWSRAGRRARRSHAQSAPAWPRAWSTPPVTSPLRRPAPRAAPGGSASARRAPGPAVVHRARPSGAVATSGGYERGDHVLDPRPADPRRGRRRTVCGPDLAIADAFATGLLAAGRRPRGRAARRLRGTDSCHRTPADEADGLPLVAVPSGTCGTESSMPTARRGRHVTSYAAAVVAS